MTDYHARPESQDPYGRVRGMTPEGQCGHGYPLEDCPLCHPVQPIRTRMPDDPVSESVETHPAYAMIGASRVSSTGHYLYGSDFRHQHFVTITVRRGEMHRSLSRDWHSAREEYIEVALSEAQWATFVSSLNTGSGVPCTLQAKDGRYVSRIPQPEPKADLFKSELTERFSDGRKALAELRARLEAGKGGKESLKLLDRALREISGSAQFVSDQFGEHMEEVVERVKIEVNAYAQQTLMRMGLDAAKTDLPLALEAKAEEKKP